MSWVPFFCCQTQANSFSVPLRDLSEHWKIWTLAISLALIIFQLMVSWQHWFWFFFFGNRNEAGLYFIVLSHQSREEKYICLQRYYSLPECKLYCYLHHFQLCTVLVGKVYGVGVHAAVQDAGKSCHRCSIPSFVAGLSFYQGTEREAAGRDRETAPGFLIMLNVFWDFKDTTELLGVAWLILLLWKKAQRVIDFKVSLFKLALQPAGAELVFQ